jgi:hypothetical protein
MYVVSGMLLVGKDWIAEGNKAPTFNRAWVQQNDKNPDRAWRHDQGFHIYSGMVGCRLTTYNSLLTTSNLQHTTSTEG